MKKQTFFLLSLLLLVLWIPAAHAEGKCPHQKDGGTLSLTDDGDCPYAKAMKEGKGDCPYLKDGKCNCPCMKDGGANCPCVKDGKGDCPCMKDGKCNCPCMKDGAANCPCAKDGKCNCPCAQKAENKAGVDAPLFFDGPQKEGVKATCPVMKDVFTIGKNSPFSQYKGKYVYFCCPGCKPKFDKEPEKFLSDVK